ncbi:hypothetical protein IAG44_19175 [Streptomyces roseirectus]|uniref:Uncharacterized protein n=1 Tax=Streptomyces roseirectus TaxID=2768066 RepID=A0A7H0IEX9_9ACTN|nr:hypothetical protein [Streptomyces roseirectus]QNP71345.1 hypothetical protein IAG44_19175 [Streptomyces roseirectus]
MSEQREAGVAEAVADEVVEGAVESPTGITGAPPARGRRVLRGVLRWGAAVVVFGVLGAGTAYGITRMERTDVPGLATESDGRWEYPEVQRPVTGSDLRSYVLPAPEGAVEDTALRGRDGWLGVKDFLAVYASAEDRVTVGQYLTDYGLRHVAARGWTTPDGTRTAVYLLRLDDPAVTARLRENLTGYDDPVYPARGATETTFDDAFAAESNVAGVDRDAYDEKRPYGAEQLRQAYLFAGDVMAVVLQSRKGSAGAVPFQQTVVLQSQLLASVPGR